MNEEPNPNVRFVVLAAIDDGELADPTAAAAARYADAARGAELHFVHVVTWLPTQTTAPDMDATSVLEAARATLDAQVARLAWKGRAVCHLAMGDPAHEILQTAARVHADLIITGCHGRTGIKRAFVGSVAEKVVRGASCPVLVVRATDYERTLAVGIEPPCSACLAKQHASRGAVMWCDRHAEHHPKAHLHYEFPRDTFAMGSMVVRPE